MTSRSAVLGLVGILASLICAATESSVEEALRDRWIAAYNSGDAEALAAMYAADARLRQGYCPVVTGRQAIEDYWRKDLGDGLSTTRLEVEDTLTHGDFMYLSGRYAVEFAVRAAQPKTVGGTYSQIWRREGNAGWTIHRETWTNLACAEIVIDPDGEDHDSPDVEV